MGENNTVQTQRKNADPATIEKIKFRRKLVIILAGFVALILVAVFASVLIFRVNNISVTGNVECKKESIIQNSGIKTGGLIFTVNEEKAKTLIETNIPNADNVKITIKLPSTVIIHAEEAVERYAVKYQGAGYAITNGKMKVIRISDTVPDGAIEVDGYGGSVSYEPGTEIPFDGIDANVKLKEMLIELAEAVDETGMKNIQLVDISDTGNIYMIYDNRIVIKIGAPDDISAKYSLAKKTLISENKLSPTEYGYLTIKTAKKAIFSPKDYKEVTELVEYLNDDETSVQDAEEESENAETDATSGGDENAETTAEEAVTDQQ